MTIMKSWIIDNNIHRWENEAKKSANEKSPNKKLATQKSGTEKSTIDKATTKKSTTKKSATKKSTAKSVSKKSTTKKPTTKQTTKKKEKIKGMYHVLSNWWYCMDNLLLFCLYYKIILSQYWCVQADCWYHYLDN